MVLNSRNGRATSWAEILARKTFMCHRKKIKKKITRGVHVVDSYVFDETVFTSQGIPSELLGTVRCVIRARGKTTRRAHVSRGKSKREKRASPFVTSLVSRPHANGDGNIETRDCAKTHTRARACARNSRRTCPRSRRLRRCQHAAVAAARVERSGGGAVISSFADQGRPTWLGRENRPSPTWTVETREIVFRVDRPATMERLFSHTAQLEFRIVRESLSITTQKGAYYCGEGNGRAERAKFKKIF